MAKNTTAINRYNAAATFNSGKVGNVRFYQKGEKSYVRSAYNSSINNPRTMAQMNRRLKWASTSLIWKRLKSFLEHSFEGVTPSVSTCNLFMKANGYKPLGTYLPQGDKNELLLDYTISNGQLEGITDRFATFEQLDSEDPTPSSVHAMSRLVLPTGTYATIAALSTALLANNENLKEGDQITFLNLTQRQMVIGTENETPYRVSARATKFILDTTDNTAAPSGFVSVYGKFGFVISLTTGVTLDKAFAFIHSRKEEGKLLCSAENICVCNYVRGIAFDHLTNGAYLEASASYGDETKLYLQPSRFKSKIEVFFRNDSSDLTYDGNAGTFAEPSIMFPADDYVAGAGSYEVNTPVTITPNFGTGSQIFQCVNADTLENIGNTQGQPFTFDAPVNGLRVLFTVRFGN